MPIYSMAMPGQYGYAICRSAMARRSVYPLCLSVKPCVQKRNQPFKQRNQPFERRNQPLERLLNARNFAAELWFECLSQVDQTAAIVTETVRTKAPNCSNGL